MPSTPSPLIRAEQQETGEKLNTWGGDLNQVIRVIEQAICGVLIKPLTGNYTLTIANYVTDEARNATLIFTAGAGLSAAPTVTVPQAAKSWHVDNRCGYPITFMAGGTTVTVPVGRQADVFSDGTGNLFMLEPVGAAAAATEGFAIQAATSATAAASSAGTATQAHNTAIDNKNYAAEWAVKAVDSLISAAAGGNGTTDYSARHYASKASGSATAAAGSATSAGTSATSAATSATAAANSAAGAAAPQFAYGYIISRYFGA